MSASTIPTPAETEALSPLQRIVNIFVAPSKVFADLRRDPSWWVAWVLISVFGLLFMYAMQTKIGFDQITRNEIAANAKSAEALDKLPPEQREQRIDISAKITKYVSYGTPIVILIIAVIVAAVLMATFNFGMGAEIKFGAALAVVLWAWVPGILKSILGAIALFAGSDPEAFNVRNPVATNLGFFLSRTDHPVLYSLASSIDIFAIWYIVLMGIGFAAISKVKRGTATWTVASWYILITLVGAGWVALMG
jgi:Yip1 domain